VPICNMMKQVNKFRYCYITSRLNYTDCLLFLGLCDSRCYDEQCTRPRYEKQRLNKNSGGKTSWEKMGR
jgi:hypothetical protein